MTAKLRDQTKMSTMKTKVKFQGIAAHLKWQLLDIKVIQINIILLMQDIH